MKVVLKKTVRDLGQAGEIVAVSDAYARNYLLPRGLAVPATANAVAAVQVANAERAAERNKQAAASAQAKEQLGSVQIRLSAGASPAGRLYQAIHVDQVLIAIRQQQQLSLSGVSMDPPAIKNTGRQPVTLIWPDRSRVTLTVEVGPS